MKICKNCNKSKELEEFDKHKKYKDGRTNICKECRRANIRRIYREKRDGIFISKSGKPRLTENQREVRKKELQEYHKKYRKENADIIRENKKKALVDAKNEGIEAYGGRCQCCGEGMKEFLTLEHINGRKKGKRKRTGKSAWLELKRKGFPKKGYTVLCFNCNCAKGAYGSCPHTWDTDK